MKEKSVKQFTKTLAAVSLLIPVNAQSLGIGELELHSALNQSLNAQIRLQLAPGESADDIRVRLAPPEKFDQAGVPWSYFLSKIKFQTIPQANGSVIIKVTSREPLTEPFLNFLLEVNWPQGSQFREFTALIDPPAEYRAPVIPSASANNEYLADNYQNYERPIKKPRMGKKRTIRNEQASNITAQTPSSGEYGPVQENLTLWRIADELGSERNVSTKLMMEALYQANPNAFINGNINSLKAGAILRIPETAAITESLGKRTEAKSLQKTAKPSTAANKSLELVAPVTESRISDNAKIDGQVKPSNEAPEERGNNVSNGTSVPDKDLELQTRIEKLEQQLNMMQELLALKDQQLAKLQVTEKSTAKPDADKTIAQSEPPSVTASVPKPATEQPLTAQPEPTIGQPPAPTQSTEPTKPTAPTPAKPKPKPRPTPAAQVEPESNLLSSPLYTFGLGGAGLGLLGLLGWLLWRKHKIDSKTNTESMFASASQIKMPDGDSSLALPVMDVSSATNYDVGTVGESSFISDFTPSDFEAFDTDQSEIDPLSEADVYLAYGRYQQAEELIRQAIKDYPGKDEYKLKLLEIFYANENKERFNDYAHELTAAGKNNDTSFWNKVCEMGKEIIPESVLFGGTATSFSSNESITEQPVPSSQSIDFMTDDDLSLELDALNSDFIDLSATPIPEQSLTESTQSDIEWQTDSTTSNDNGLDFDLSFLSENKPSSSEQDNLITDFESVDFNLDQLPVEPDQKPEIIETADKTDSLESFDFNFDLDSPPTSSTAQTDDSNLEELDMVSLESFEFPDFEDNQNQNEVSLNEVSTQTTAVDSPDDFEFDFNFDTPNAPSDSEEFDLGVSDLTDMDEFETKIDLAKAYVDMGDHEAAKTIAEEVMVKGNPDQKKAAQALLNELI